MSFYIGVDIGTFESKGVLVDADGSVVAAATRPHRMIVPQAGWAEHRANEDWWGDFTAICRALLAESAVPSAEIRAVGASAIGPCMLPLDARGEPLMNAVLYGVDTRAAAEVEELTAAIGSDAVLERCGNALTSQSVGPKILWLRRHRPDVFAPAARVVSSTTYLVRKLTGACVIDHYTAANFSPLYDMDRMAWTDALAPDIIPLKKLPDIAWTTDIAGCVTPQAASATGLAAGTPVIVGTIDAAAEAVSVGVRASGDAMLMYGSTVFVIALTPARIRDPRLWTAPWLFPGQHAAMAGLATSGTLTRWFADQLARDLDPQTATAALASEARNAPAGANGLVVLPYFSGERTPIYDPHAKGIVFGIDLTHTRGDLFRAILEGIAFGTNHILQTYAEAGHPPRALFCVGGGTRNEVWTQATSDVSGQTQIVREKTVGAAYGDAFLAALSVGDVRADDIDRWNPVASEIAADPQTAEVYARQYAVYRDLYPRTRDLLRRPEPDAPAGMGNDPSFV